MSNEKCPHCGEPMLWTAYCPPCGFTSDYMPHGPRVPAVPSREALEHIARILEGEANECDKHVEWMHGKDSELMSLEGVKTRAKHCREVAAFLRSLRGGR